MRFTVQSAELKPSNIKDKTLVFPLAQDKKGKVICPPWFKNKARLSAPAFKKLLESIVFKGKSGEISIFPAVNGVKADRLVFLGLGSAKDHNKRLLEKAGASLYQCLAKNEIKETSVILEQDKDEGLIGGFLVSGALLASYRFDRHQSKNGSKASNNHPKKLTVLSGSHKEIAVCIKKAKPMSEGVFLTRDLVNEPPNILHPESFVKRIKEAFRGTNVKITVMGERKLKAMGADLLLSVGQASTRESHVVIMEYNGTKSKKSKPVAFVGKGVSFDTGGTNLKPFQGLLEMKMDMGGAGVVVGLMKTLAARKAKVHAIGAVGLVENMVAGNASRPSDVVQSMSGQTVEILNTDAEGRLVLADVMWYVQKKYKPATMIDLATLTGAVIVSLGNEYAGLFANDNSLANQLLKAGETACEPLWRLPLCDAYTEALKSEVADMKNISAGSVGAGSATAAAFLQKFVQEGVNWAHLDIAGVTFHPGSWAPNNQSKKTASGYGVQLLDQWVSETLE